MELFVKVIIGYLTTFLMYVAYIDYRDREFNLLPVALHYPLVVILSFLMGQSLVETLFGFLSLFLIFYLTQLFLGGEDKIVVGGLDIVIAPLFTTMFGLGALFYVTLFFIIFVIISNCSFISRLLKGKHYKVDANRMPLVPIMIIPYLFFVMNFLFN